mmetsp:Transcript_24449/g.31759  ORF Transcript_24449/g.31759 Transcript_24449/m.31759 type:complete len:309 (+) Transcript_24449:104-1030(+)
MAQNTKRSDYFSFPTSIKLFFFLLNFCVGFKLDYLKSAGSCRRSERSTIKPNDVYHFGPQTRCFGTKAMMKGGVASSRIICRAEGENSEEAASTEEQDDPRLYSINLSRATGIDFGTDISFRWVYVMGLEPGGAADLTGLVEKGHQIVAVNGESVLGATFDYVMQKLATVEGREVNLTFFIGSREELQEATVGSTGPRTVTLTVREKGKSEKTLTAPAGATLRDVLIANNINVYQSVTRWTNCKGKQLCGTCIVNIADGMDNCSRKSLDERSTLRDNPESYRLSCVTNMYGDVTVETFPEIGAAQWTR